MSTSVRLVQKKSSRQATLGWARRESKSLSWKDLVRLLLRRGRNLAANISAVLLWTTRFTTPNVPLKQRERWRWLYQISEIVGSLHHVNMKHGFTFQFPHERHRQRRASFSFPVPPLSPETPVDLQRHHIIWLKQVQSLDWKQSQHILCLPCSNVII